MVGFHHSLSISFESNYKHVINLIRNLPTAHIFLGTFADYLQTSC